ncbi:hypothetical protein AMAG_05794 [Allomyces macrogynus ATCC 38327]|uniref:Uncharacterized protein n=1 Tax=Allomyces macrogynus (strain ATCC 38327) TaxID=578462 RepID=A0A0L0SDC4_ALLM3|nr:hypothetical protein AMAG_05794 [Allomyces macrogynus ATCC 38327]|eukprot:KNE60405.1 hypothetical protein AMAG_05794 [Allomyces macrogynus ATCC 38327]
MMALKQENEVLRARQRRKHHKKSAPPAAPPKHDPHVAAMDELRAAVVALEARLAHPPTPAAAAVTPKPPAMVTVATGPSFIAPASDDDNDDNDDNDDDVAWDLPQQKIEIHGAPSSPIPAATDMSFVAVADMAPLLRQIGTLAQANHDLLARQAELEQLLADALDDAPRRKLQIEYESKLADLADQLTAAQNQATSLATAVPQLAVEIETRDRVVASLRAALEMAEAKVVGDEVECRVAALHAAVVEQHRAVESVWDQSMAEAAVADARRQIDHLAEMVSRAERARDVAVTDARRARAEAAERVKAAEVARRAAQARLKRVLSGVYAYVAGGSRAGEEVEESDVSVVSDASVDATLEALRGARARAARWDDGRAAWAAVRRAPSRVDAHDGRLSVVTGYDDDGDDELDATTTTTATSVSSFLDASAAAASSRGGRTASASPTKSAVGNAAVPGLAPSPADRRDRAPVLPGV